MKWRMRMALWLYPRPWRTRYAREFTALLEDVGAGWREFWDVARGGLKMRVLTWNFASVTVGCALLGAVVGGGWSLRTPDQYISTAVIRVADDGKAGARLLRAQTGVLSRPSLAEMILSEDLYRQERAKQPMEQLVEDMRNRHIRVVPLRSSGEGSWRYATAMAISFQYPDAAKARSVTRKLTEGFVQSGAGVQVLDEPSLPIDPSSPNRRVITLIGLAIGLAVGVLAVGVRRWPIVAASGAAAAAAALAIAFAIPDQFVSSAVLKLDPPTPGLVAAVLDDAVLQRIVEKDSMQLYRKERVTQPIAEVVRRMRERDLVVRETPQGISIAFRYVDRYKAQAAVREFVTTLVEMNVVEARKGAPRAQTLEVIAPANLPQAPASPNRLAILIAGLTAGLATGIVVTRKRRLRTLAA